MSESNLLVTIEDAVATLVLNRPQAGNAIDLPLAQALVQAAIRCDSDPSIRCVVLSGAGRLFCAGGDLGAFAAAGERIPAFLSELAGTLHMALSRLMRMAKPLLVLVNGPAAGAGMSLALGGDIVLAARSAHFTPAYGAVGLTPDGGLSWHLPRLVGMRRAQEMLLLNQRVEVAQAETIGLITRAVDDDRLAEEGASLARALTRSATQAIGGTRRLLLESFQGEFEAHLEREARSIAALGAGPEAREGIRAFTEKRRPQFHSGA
jgi:2-(1,2-epoxy-1,2-dihydrophenyl)acetyl-CoA isomerase